jgi:hypothetical protein
VYIPSQDIVANTAIAKSPTTTAQVIPTLKNFLLYKDPSDRFTIEYPHNLISELGRHLVVTFLSPLAGSIPNFRAYLQVEIVTKDVPSFNPNNATTTILAGNLAYKVTKFSIEGHDKIERTELWTRMDNKAYHITYATIATQYAVYHPTIQAMLDSFDLVHLASSDNLAFAHRH